MLKKGTKVKISRKYLDTEDQAPIEEKYHDQIGVITKEGDGESVDTMIQVTVKGVGCDAFWPEELEKVSK